MKREEIRKRIMAAAIREGLCSRADMRARHQKAMYHLLRLSLLMKYLGCIC